MEIKTQIESGGKTYKVIYRDEDPSTNLNDSTLHGVHAYCFYKDKLVVVLNSKNLWTPPGGAIEKGETYEEAIIREVREEANMKVLYQHYIGYQDVWFEKEKMMSRQARVFLSLNLLEILKMILTEIFLRLNYLIQKITKNI